MYYRFTSIICLGLVIGCTSSKTEPTPQTGGAKSVGEKLTAPESPPATASSNTPEPKEVPVEPGGWGNLKGRFVYEGDAPTSIRLNPTKDISVCGKHDLFNESLIVNPESKGIQNVVVYLYTKKGQSPPIHESYASTANGEVALDNEFCRFNNHITVMRTTQTLLIRNLDPIGHNTKIDTLSNTAINPILPANGDLKQLFPKAERNPVPVSCSIHPWMNGYVLIKDHPYVTVTDENGEFEIKNLPTGNWTFCAWQEKCKSVQEVKISGATAKWKRGRFEQAVAKGETDMGEILIPAAQFD